MKFVKTGTKTPFTWSLSLDRDSQQFLVDSFVSLNKCQKSRSRIGYNLDQDKLFFTDTSKTYLDIYYYLVNVIFQHPYIKLF